MPSFIRHPKDFWTGAIYIGFGTAAVLLARGYSMGSAAKMGPAYFPSILGALLVIIGATAVLRSLVRKGEPIEQFAVKTLALVLGAVILFGLAVRGAGLLPAVVLLVLISALASMQFRLLPSLLLALGLAAFAGAVFIKALGVPIPMIGPWFGF